jgi:carbamate kinase
VCLLTHVLVAEDDPAFAEPTKPVGPFYDEEQARGLERDRGWQVVHDAGRGWRRVVPSPAPLEVVELGAIRSLLASGSIVVACGGGGIPATRRGEHLAGIDAVIDKDRASSLLARGLGADRLVILTEVPAVYSGFGTDDQQELRELTADDAAALAPELAAGSMRPKLEASVEFVRATGHEALITSPAALADALAGRSGTSIHR